MATYYEEFRKLSDTEIAQRIQQMVDDHREEQQELDFKQIDSLNFLVKSKPENEKSTKKCKLAKHLSAFTNSTGGIIIFGIKEQKDPLTNQRTMLDFDNGINKADFKRNMLTDIINAAVYPSLTGVYIKEIENPNNPDGLIIVLIIPESTHGAVQVVAKGEHQFRYFHRNITSNRPMHHSLLQLVNNKLLHPDLELIFDSEEGIYFEFTDPDKPFESYLYIKPPIILNKGKIIAQYNALSIKVSTAIERKLGSWHNDLFKKSGIDDFYYYTRAANSPIFPGMKVDLFDSHCMGNLCLPINLHNLICLPGLNCIDEDNLANREHTIEFILYADNSPAKSYKLILDTTKIMTKEDLEKYKLSCPKDSYNVNHPYKIFIKDIPDILRLEIP